MPTAKHLIGKPCETASISDGLDDTWPSSKRPDATTATPSMLGPPGWICEVDVFLLEVAQLAWRTTSPSWLPPISQPSCMLILVLPAARAPIDSRLPPAIRPPAANEAPIRRRRIE